MIKTYKISTNFYFFLFFSIIAHCSLLISHCDAQPSITWQRLYKGPIPTSYAYGNAICKGPVGFYYICGYAPNGGYVLKINDYGDTIWMKSSLPSRLKCIAPTRDGGCVASGDYDSAFTIKLDMSGNIIWFKTYSSNSIDCLDIKQTLDGGFIMCGNSSTAGYISKTDSLGNVMWEKFILLQAYIFELHSICPTAEANYICAGFFSDGSQKQTYVVKLNAFGDTIWIRHNLIQGHSADVIKVAISGNNFLLSGNTANVSNVEIPYIAYFDTSGTIYSSYLLNNLFRTLITCLEVVGTNRIVYSAININSSFSLDDTLIFKVCDTLGNTIHKKQYSVPRQTYRDVNSVLPLPNGDIIFLGEAKFGTIYYEIYGIRTDSLLNFPQNIFGIENNQHSVPGKISISQNYPNPFNSSTIIYFSVPYLEDKAKLRVRLIIYDVLGKQVLKLIDNDKRPGLYKVSWYATEYPSGIYFCKLSIGDMFNSIKMVLVR